MPLSNNAIDNNVLAALGKRAGPQVTSAIKAASASTGVNFAYLMEQAAAESNFNATAEAKTSSAAGLYQFIESTWLNMVKNHGDEHGLGKYADMIDDKGRVNDPALKEEILELRKDPKTAALLAAEFAADNKEFLEKFLPKTYGALGSTDLYFAHFLGASGATGFLSAMHEDPLGNAADLFPKAARANRNVFYDQKTGESRTLAGVYEFFDKKFKADDSEAILPKAKNTLMAQAPETAKSSLAKEAVIEMLMAENMKMDKSVLKFITHPALEHIAPELSFGWERIGLMPSPSLLMSPSELMLLAQMKVPNEENDS